MKLTKLRQAKTCLLSMFFMLLLLSPGKAWALLSLDEHGYYNIHSRDEFIQFAQMVNKGNYRIKGILKSDITLNSNVLRADGSLKPTTFTAWTPIGTSTYPYAGTFDGNGFTIRGLIINESTKIYKGLFGYVADGTVIKNVNVEDSYIKSGNQCAGICARITSTSTSSVTIENCKFSGTIECATSQEYAYVGGICGRIDNTASTTVNIKDCKFEGKITTSKFIAGGICGYLHDDNSTLNIENCIVKGSVTASRYAAGILAYRNKGSVSISNCRNEANVSTTNTSGNGYVAGILAYDVTSKSLNLSECYNAGNISSIYGEAAGILSYKSDGNTDLRLCSNIGNVTATNGYAAGICAKAFSTPLTIRSCSNSGTIYSTGTKSSFHSAGILAYNYSGSITIEKCCNTGLIKSDVGSGRCAGIIAYKQTGKIDVEDCYNTGDIQSSKYYAYGIAGLEGSSKTITSCYNTGYLKGQSSSSYYSSEYPISKDFSGVSNCYYITEKTNYHGGRTENQFRSGRVCFELNNDIDDEDSGSIIWRQNIGEDESPKFVGSLVTKAKWQNCSHQYVDGSKYCSICGEHKPLDIVDGYCKIYNKEDLYAFSAMVENGNTTINAKLMADVVVNKGLLNNLNLDTFDIWKPIGVNDNCYSGTFDGQGHTVSGLLINKKNITYAGLFGKIKGATIKNINVNDSKYSEGFYIGGICAFVYGGDNIIENCHYKGELKNNTNSNGNVGGIASYVSSATLSIINCSSDAYLNGYKNVGGMIGSTANSNISVCGCSTNSTIMSPGNYVGGVCGQLNSTTAKINGCHSKGRVSAENSNYIGGICGYCDATSSLVIDKSYNEAEIYGYSYVAGILGYGSSAIDININNCYNTGKVIAKSSYAAGIANAQNSDSKITNSFSIGAVSASSYVYQISNGSVDNCYYLADIASEDGGCTLSQLSKGEVCWLLNGKKEDESVVWRQTIGLDSNPTYSGTIITGISLNCQHRYGDDDLCEICGSPRPLEKVDGYYLIYSADNLYAFANLVNKGDRAINGRVMKDIVLNENVLAKVGVGNTDGLRNWTPIGMSESTSNGYDRDYSGIFDGANHTISGLYCVDFSYGSGFISRSEKCTIQNLKLVDSYINGESSTGGICGYTSNGSAINNCSFSGSIIGFYDFGGIVGYNYGNIIIENCKVEGSIKGSGSRIAGICGNSNGEAIIKNCTNNANIIGNSSIAGIIGSIYDSYGKSKIDSCYNFGTINAEYDKAAGIVANIEYTYAYISNCLNEGDIYCGTHSAGGIVGYLYNYGDNSIKHCRNKGNINGKKNSVGGIVGYFYYSDSIEDCINEGSVTGEESIGGIVGNCNLTSIKNCKNSGSVSSSSSNYIGGICGYHYTSSNNSILENCQNSGAIVATGTGVDVGGLCGYSYFQTISGCSNSANITGNSYVAGAFGYAGTNLIITIKSFSNTGNIVGKNYVAGMAGYADNLNISYSFNRGSVSSTQESGDTYVGGICANFYKNCSVVDCYNKGNVITNNPTGYVGCFVSTEKTGSSVRNCFNVGELSKTDNTCSNDIWENSFYLSETTTGDGGKTAEQFASGTVAALLNAGRSGVNTVWYQNGDYPDFQGEEIQVGEHLYDNGFCMLHQGEYQHADYDVATGYYLISNAGQLYWFADKVKAGDNTINGRVVADIVINNNVLGNPTSNFRTWTPIGSDKNHYSGHFDGGNFTIKGMFMEIMEESYHGMFSYCENAELKNLNLADSYMKGYVYVGSICGKAENTKFSNITSTTHTEGCAYIGGLVGWANKCTFENCTKQLETVSTCSDVAGLCYDGNGSTFNNCKNLGDVRNRSGRVAGLVCQNAISITNCVNKGNITNLTSAGTAGIVVQGCPTLENCRNEGTITGAGGNGVAGISIESAMTITSCTNTGDILSTSVGGNMGGICARAANGATFKDCRNEGNVSGQKNSIGASGICHYVSQGSFTNCSNSGTIDGWGYGASGISSSCPNATFKDCSNSGNVTAHTYDGSTYYGAAGISAAGMSTVGIGHGISFENCTNTGAITDSVCNYGAAGIALYGFTFSNCRNEGVIYGGGAGAAGINLNKGEAFTSCTNTGDVIAIGTGNAIAGICVSASDKQEVVFTDCHNLGDILGYDKEKNVYMSAAGICFMAHSASFSNCSNSGNLIAANSGAAGILTSNASSTNSVDFDNCVNSGDITCVIYSGLAAGISLANGTHNVIECSNTGNVTGTSVSTGICYYASVVKSCKNEGSIIGGGYGAAGICVSNATLIEDCTNSGDITANGGAGAAGIATSMSNGKITNCNNDADITFNAGGAGAAGIAISGVKEATNCHNTGNITSTGGYGAAGVIASATGTIENCTNTGAITLTGAGSGAAGIVILISDATIKDCHNSGDIRSTAGGNGGSAGIAVTANGELIVNNCYNTGNISNIVKAAGILAYHSMSADISKCFNTGNITADSASSAGIVAQSYSGDLVITDCYNQGVVKTIMPNYKGEIFEAGILGQLTPTISVEDAYTQTITNCYSTDSECRDKIAPDYVSIVAENCHYLTKQNSDDFANGTITKMLNNGRTGETIVWYQNGEFPGFEFVEGTNLILSDDNVAFAVGEEYKTITYTRALGSNWNTLCLPFAFNAADCNKNGTAVSLFAVKAINNDCVELVQITSVSAGQPVIFYTEAKNLNITVENTITSVADPVDNATMKGKFVESVITSSGNEFYLKGNKFYHSNSFTVKPFRGYMTAATSSYSLKMAIADQVIDEVVEDKAVAEPSLVSIFNAIGQRVERMSEKGIYILQFSDGSTRKVCLDK